MIEKPSEGSQINQSSLQKVLVVGIGSEYRNDDSVGLVVAREIHKKLVPSVTVKEESGEGAALIEAWQGYETVILVDAISSGAKPGTIYEIDVNKNNMPAKFFHYSTHAFSVAEAIELARAMKTLPPKILIYGIESENFSAGTSIAKVVQESAKEVVKQILKKLK